MLAGNSQTYGRMRYEFTVWIYGMNIRFEYTVWIYSMNIRYEYTVWIYGMNIRYEYTVWIYGMNIRYEYTVLANPNHTIHWNHATLITNCLFNSCHPESTSQTVPPNHATLYSHHTPLLLKSTSRWACVPKSSALPKTFPHVCVTRHCRHDRLYHCPIQSNTIFNPIQSNPIQSNPIQSNPIQSNPI